MSLQTTTPKSIWMTTAEAAEYTRKPTRAAFRMWARRHHLAPAGRLYSRRDIDVVLTVLQKKGA